MKIIICDDEPSELNIIYTYIKEYINERQFDIAVKKYSSPTALLEFEKNNNSDTLYILDIVMPETNGIELGREIRKNNKKAVIIYLTTSKEFMLDAFSVKAFTYLIKPFDKSELFSELDQYFENVQKPVKRIIIKNNDGALVLPINDIIAVEYSNHRLIYHLTENRKTYGIYQKKPFDAQTESLMELGIFVKISASYLINMKNVRIITKNEFIMTDESTYKISRKYADARKRYIDYAMYN